jgi:hypothetical protein
MFHNQQRANQRASKNIVSLSLLTLALLSAHGAAFAGATLSNGVLVVDAAGASGTVKVESLNSLQVRLYGVPGVADGVLFSPVSSIQVRGGSGNENFDFDIQNSALAIALNTGAGDSETKVQWRSANGNSGNARFDITTGSGFNKIDYGFESLNGRTTMDFNVNGAGRNEIKTNLQIKQAVSPDSWAAIAVRLNLADGDNKVESLVSSELRDLNLTLAYTNAREASSSINADTLASNFNLDYSNTGTTGSDNEKIEVASEADATAIRILSNGRAGNDISDFKLGQKGTGQITVNFRNDQGIGDDLSKFIVDSEQGIVYLNGDVKGQAGNDFALVESAANATRTTFLMEGGTGDDNFSYFVTRGSLAPTAPISPIMRGGDGNDTLTLYSAGPLTHVGGVPGSYEQMDGGAGNDFCDGFGEFIACETIK